MASRSDNTTRTAARRALGELRKPSARLAVTSEDATVEVPKAALAAFAEILRNLADGVPASVIALDAELTSQQVAQVLGLSREFVLSLFEDGTIPSREIDKQPHARLEDVLAYRQRHDSGAKDALDELTREAQELGLGY
jgi:hypothetical protein